MCAASSSGTDRCPTCRGLTRLDDPTTTDGLLCIACGGTGNRQEYRQLQAYRIGFADGMEAMRDAMPQPPEPMGTERLAAALDEQEREAGRWRVDR